MYQKSVEQIHNTLSVSKISTKAYKVKKQVDSIQPKSDWKDMSMMVNDEDFDAL